MKQRLVAERGKILVSRPLTAHFFEYNQQGIISQELSGADGRTLEMKFTDGQYRTVRSPWGLVIDVGKPETTLYGTTLKTDVEVGDWVCLAEIGLNVPLVSSSGEMEFIYAVAFDGVVGRLEVECGVEGCGYVNRKNPRQLICPKCGAGPVAVTGAESETEVRLVEPTSREVKAAEASKVRS